MRTLWQTLVVLLLVFGVCVVIGAGYGACQAGAHVTYRLLSGERP